MSASRRTDRLEHAARSPIAQSRRSPDPRSDAHAQTDSGLRRHELRRVAAAGKRPVDSAGRGRGVRAARGSGWRRARGADGRRRPGVRTPACTRSVRWRRSTSRSTSRRLPCSARSTCGCPPTSASSASWTRCPDFTPGSTHAARPTAIASRRCRSSHRSIACTCFTRRGDTTCRACATQRRTGRQARLRVVSDRRLLAARYRAHDSPPRDPRDRRRNRH